MRTLAQSIFIASSFGVERELPHAGSALENPYVYDASARELKVMADRGRSRSSRSNRAWPTTKR